MSGDAAENLGSYDELPETRPSEVRSDDLLVLLRESRDELHWFNEDWQHRQGCFADGGIRRVVRLIQKIDTEVEKANAKVDRTAKAGEEVGHGK